jgi:predicted extracellular nuclease
MKFPLRRSRFVSNLAVVSFSLLLIAYCFALAARAQKQYSIAEIQGDKNASPHEGETVSVSGIVTARTKTGFFLQAPDDKTDGNPATSEGIFVFTRNAPPADVAVGSVVTVSGRVEEYRNRNDTGALTTTEISHRVGQDSLTVISKGNPLPKPMVLTAADFALNTIDELERFEGMRVTIPEMVAVAPTGGRVDIKNASAVSDGVFFGVVKGMARPFREPGLDIRDLNAMADREKVRQEHPKLQFFDANPEIIRVDTNEQLAENTIGGGGQQSAPSLNVVAQMVLADVTGVLHYAFGRVTLLPDFDKKITASSTIKSNPLPAPTERQFSIAGMNLENFFDDKDDPDIKEDVLTTEAFERRLKKVSMAVRDLLQMPDVIGTVEVENLSTLKRLAERINSDAAADGKPNPKYESYLVEGNDGRGIDVGYMVKSSRVKVTEIKQLGKGEKMKNPDTGFEEFLNDRPPLMLRATVDDAKTGKSFAFTLIVNHLKSMLGYNDPKQMANVRLKKKLQAEFLARLVQERLKAEPNERIALIGDFNAFQFNDGVMDVIGTIKGTPAAKDAVLIASDDMLNPDLTDLVDVIAAKEKYSYTFDGNAQAIDHILISPAFVNYVKGFGFARVNADFPESFRNDDRRPERYSDHDPAAAYFSLDGRPQ